jgi:hypothetical protein
MPPTFCRGEMFDFSTETPDVLLFTGNSTITKAGKLVMGRGAALEAKLRFPGCDKLLGSLALLQSSTSIKDRIGFNDNPYGILILSLLASPPKILGVFQVKRNFLDHADPSLIMYSVTKLNRLCQSEWKDKKIWLNFPGIGAGGLSREVVWPLIQEYLEWSAR